MRSIEFSDGFTSSGAPVGGTLPAGGSQDFENAGVSGSPSSGYSRLHFDTNGLPVKRNSSGTDLNIATIPASSANKAVYVDSNGYLASETALDETRGGTGQSTITTGDLLYGSASNTLSKLAAGTNGTNLRMVSGIPAWVGASLSYVAKTATYTIAATDDVIAADPITSGAFTLTLPASSGNGKIYEVFVSSSTWSATGIVTIARAGSDTITELSTGLTSIALHTPGEMIRIQDVSSGVWRVLQRVIPEFSKTYTPTVSSTFGTVSSASGIWRRDRNYAVFRTYWVNGTVSGSSASVSLDGLTIDTGVLLGSGKDYLGRSVATTNSGTAANFSSEEMAVTYITGVGTSDAAFSKQGKSSLLELATSANLNSSYGQLTEFRIPVSGWNK